MQSTVIPVPLGAPVPKGREEVAQLPAGLLLRMSAYVIILHSHLYSSLHFRTISLVERALVGGHCVRRLIRGHRVCPAGRLIRSLTDEGRGFDSHIVHTLDFFKFFFLEF